MTCRTITAAALALAALAAGPFAVAPAHAWGAMGHRVVGQIAEDHLSEKARAAVRGIAGPRTLAMLATWPDGLYSEADWAFASPWHYVSVDEGTLLEDVMRRAEASADPDNLVEAIEYFSGVLRGERDKIKNLADVLSCHAPRSTAAGSSCRPVEPRDGSLELTALSFLVHMIGDLHQPLHVGRRGDQGGNRVAVLWFDEIRNLHSVWDSAIIEKEGLSFTELTRFIEAELGGSVEPGDGGPRDWARESIAYRHRLYEVYEKTDRESRLPDLGYDYAHRHVDTVKKRLYLAGLRLAGLLNAIYD